MALELLAALQDSNGDFTAIDPLFTSNVLLCPRCLFNYVHLETVEIVRGHDNYEAWAGRGDLIVISGRCEDGHEFQVCFGFHKGQTYAYFDSIKDRPSHKITECANITECGLNHTV